MPEKTHEELKAAAERRDANRLARDWGRANRVLAENPQLKKYLWGKADRETAARRRFSFCRLVEEARWEVPVNDGGQGFKLSNSYAAAFARIYLNEHPEASGLIELRGSRFDSIAWQKGEEE